MATDFSNNNEAEVEYGPLSYGQRALGFLHEMSANGHAYNMSYAWYLKSELDVFAFKAALKQIVARHPVMRSTFGQHKGEMVQKIHPEMDLYFQEKDATDWENDQVRLNLVKEAYRPFDLKKNPPIRWTLFNRGEKDPILFLGLHHACTDVWSVMTLLNELKDLYKAQCDGHALELPPLEKDNSGYVKWQTDLLNSSEGRQMVEFWQKQLGGELPVLNFATDHPRPPFPSFKGESFQFSLPQELMDKLTTVAREKGASPFMICLAAYHVFLHRYTGQNDICTGVPTAGRSEEFAGIFHYYVSPVVMRSQPEGAMSFSEFLGKMVSTVKESLENQFVPFPYLAQKINHDMDPSRPPIFQTSFVWENSNRFENRKDPMVSLNEDGNEIWTLGDVKLERIILRLQFDEFDIIMKMVKVQDQYYGLIDYNPDLFEEETVVRISENFKVLLSSIASNPDETIGNLALLTDAERDQLLVDWNDTADPYPDLCPYQMFEQQVAQKPEAIAITFEKDSKTYAELNSSANQLANYLRKAGIGPDKLVGISLERSINMVLSQLGIQKAGGAYVPLDPNYPEERIEYILEEAKVSVVITQEKLKDRFKDYDAKIVCLDSGWDLIDEESRENLPHLAGMNHLSHVIYTSGSTGKPKGVAIEHHCVSALNNWTAGIYSEEELSGMLASTSLNFDLSVYETIGTLALGGSIILVENALYLPTAPAREKVKVINTVPSAIKELVRMKGIPQSVITVNLAGEPLKNAVVQSLYAIDHIQKVYNLYGPSEDTTYSTWALMERGEDYVVMIGRPLTNTQCYVLDSNYQPTPIGVPGELYMAGDGLAREYLNRPDLTEERFLPNPFAEDKTSRMYKTGDLVAYWTNGQLECLGRIDHQVKIRGFRIELGEIEAVLQRNPKVHEAVVVDREDPNGEKILVGYVTLHSGEAGKPQDFRNYLKDHLPDYMVPAFLMILEAMPLNPNGKIDRKLLPEPELDIQVTASARPQNEIERKIAEVWKDVLNLKNVGVNDKFFDLGGNSLLLPQVRFRLEEIFEREIQTTDLFQYPTISSLAKYLNPDDGGASELAFRRERISASGNHDIAVIGMAGRFPGSNSVNEFWNNLVEGKETITHFTYEELKEAGVESELLDDPEYVRARGVLGDVSLFDASFFGFSPREAEIMDPQHRFFLECSWEALENAGYNPDVFDGRIGVFAGSSMSTYYQFNIAPNKKLLDTVGAFQAMVANDKDFLATRVNYNFNLKGPGVTVQTACSTSLVAIHKACKSLLIGECDMALAGGVTIQVPQKNGYMFTEGGIHSPDGHVRPFDAKAKGMVVSSGVGIVALKRLEDAKADGDLISAVVKGSAINNDGSLKVGYTAPSVEGQSEAIADAQHYGGVNPETISYIETHGTGTGLGDPIEVAALTRAYRLGTDKNGFCALGALKSNIGHMDSAAGVGGFIKTVLALKNRTLPATLHFEKPNPSINFDKTPFYVNHQCVQWESEIRRAGVSAFGIGGTNAHVVLEEAPQQEASSQSRDHQLIVISGKTPSALEKITTNLLTHFKQNPDVNLADTAFTLQLGRKPFHHRRMMVCQDLAEGVQILETHDSKKMFSSTLDPKNRPVVFMFSGQGSQYLDMGRDLYRTEATFREDVDYCCEYLQNHIDLDLRDLWFSKNDASEEDIKAASDKLNQTSMTQPALFVIEYALAQLWMRWGVKPQAMIGHSIGEYVAACLAGVFSLKDALMLVAVRGRLMQAQPKGSMMAIPLPEDQIKPYLNDEISMATINAPNRCVVAGPDDALERLKDRLSADKLRGTILHTSHAFHSHMMDSMLAPFTTEVAKIDLQPPSLPYISNVSGTWITPEEATDPSYYANHLRNAVRFADGLTTLAEEPDYVYLEVGPGKTLMTFAKQQLGRENANRVFSSVRHPKTVESDVCYMLNNLGQLWMMGIEIDWKAFYADEQRHRTPLPSYPFEHRRFWVDPVKPEVQVLQQQGPLKKRGNMADWFYTPVWKQTVPPPRPETKESEFWMVFKDDKDFGNGLVERLQKEGHDVVVVQMGHEFAQIEKNYVVNPGQREDYEKLFDALSGLNKSPQNIIHLWSVTGQNTSSRLEFADRCVTLGFNSLILLTQVMDEKGFSDPIQLRVVSDNMHKISGETYGCPEKAPLLGACRVIPREFPHIFCRSIDITLPSTGSGAEQKVYDHILSEMASRSSDLAVAYRGAYRWLQDFETTPLKGEMEASPRLKEGGVYLISGGLGGIGLVIAEFLAKTTRAKLILTRRSSLPDRKDWDAWLAGNGENDRTSFAINKIRHLESLGSEVMVGIGDVADLRQMEDVAANARARFGEINGVVHAAGLYPSGWIQNLSIEDTSRVLSPKVRGTLVLNEIFKDSRLDFMILFSSTSVVLGNMGFADYCASNAFLDAFAHHHDVGSHTHVVAMSWDGWKEVGMAVDKGMTQEQLDNMMGPEEGVEAFRRILYESDFSQVLISPLDFQIMVHEIKMFLEASIAESDEGSDESSHGEAVQDRPVLGSSPAAVQNETQRIVVDLWQESLGVADIGIQDDFHELGGDSLLATMLASRLRRTFKIKLPPGVLAEKPTVEQLSAHIDELRGVIHDTPKPTESTVVPVEPKKVEEAKLEKVAPKHTAPTENPRPNLRTPYAPPTNDTESALCEIWANALNYDKVGIQDNFLELGGHTELATALAAKISEMFGVEIPPGTPINEPTIARVAERIETIRWASQEMDASFDEEDDDEEFEL